MERVQDYRHVIGSLVRKPRFREQLFPTMQFRLAYDGLRQWRGERVCAHPAGTLEATVDSALSLLLETDEPFDYAVVRELAEPKVPEAPALTLSGKPDRSTTLLTGSLATAGVLMDTSVMHRTVPPIQAAHHGDPVGGSFHRRRPWRSPAHIS